MEQSTRQNELLPAIPTQGIVIQEEEPFFLLCNPKLLPLKSVTLEKLEKMQRDAVEKANRMSAKGSKKST